LNKCRESAIGCSQIATSSLPFPATGDGFQSALSEKATCSKQMILNSIFVGSNRYLLEYHVLQWYVRMVTYITRLHRSDSLNNIDT